MTDIEHRGVEGIDYSHGDYEIGSMVASTELMIRVNSGEIVPGSKTAATEEEVSEQHDPRPFALRDIKEGRR